MDGGKEISGHGGFSGSHLGVYTETAIKLSGVSCVTDIWCSVAHPHSCPFSSLTV
jgi:hypothetical protein